MIREAVWGGVRRAKWLAVLCVLAAPAAARGTAADSTRSVAPPTVPAVRMPWTLGLTLERGHDDNVIQLTRQNIDRFGATPGPPRFRLAGVGDMQTIAAATARWRGRLAPHRESRVALDATFHRFDRDRIVNWREYELTAGQELTASRRHLTTLEAYASWLPRYYLGEIIDVDETVAAQASNRGAIRHSLTFAQSTYGARLEQQLFRDRLAVEGEIERAHRAYNTHFLERTNNNDEWSLAVSATPFRRWPASARVTWLRGRLAARGDLPDTLGITDVDISYDHDGVGAGLTLPWGRAAARGRFDASFMPEVRSYTSTDKFDLVRFGRENHRRDVRLRLTQRMWGPVEAIVAWERLTSRARFSEGITFPSSQTDFNEEQFGVMLRARWEMAL